MSVQLCDNEMSAQTAIAVISRCQTLLLDCEGRDLGTLGGALGLISIGVPETDTVWLFDPVTLSPDSPSMKFLLGMLSRKEVCKVVWDGRMDNVALLEKYGVGLAGVLDLQLAEIDSRSQRGETDLMRRQRLIRKVGPGQALHKPEKYEHIHGLCGLDGCLKDLKIGLEYVKDSEVTQMHRDADGQLWMDRPLPSKLLDYAANDIHAIRTLYQHFNSTGWIPSNPTSLLQASTRYLALHHEPVNTEDPFIKGGPFLPLDILTMLGGPTAECRDCHRRISVQHFSTSPRTYVRLASCRVCEAMKAKMRFSERKTAEKAIKEAKREEKTRLEAEAAAKALASTAVQTAVEAAATPVKTEVRPKPVAKLITVSASLRLADPEPLQEELRFLAPLATFMRQIRVPHFSRETMKKHLRQSIPGQPYEQDDIFIESVIGRACMAGLLVQGGEGMKSWVRLAEHDSPQFCTRCRRGDR